MEFPADQPLFEKLSDSVSLLNRQTGIAALVVKNLRLSNQHQFVCDRMAHPTTNSTALRNEGVAHLTKNTRRPVWRAVCSARKTCRAFEDGFCDLVGG